jgi:hypothetical protein
MRIAAFALLGACTFTPGEPKGSGGGSSDPGGTPAGVDAAPVANRPPCDLMDPAVQLCLDFEAPELGLDSSLGHHDATVTNATITQRAPEHALAVDVTSNVHVDETQALDMVNAITYEAWIAPMQAPPVGEYVVLANLGKYAVSVQADGKVRCELAGVQADSGGSISFGTNKWTHVACSYDRQQLMVYVNGDVSHCTPATAPIATTGVGGTAIGVPFVGAIDNIHVLSRAATASEICGHAGASGCNNSCGGPGPGPGHD